MKLSIVATLYHSEACIKDFYGRMTAVAKQLSDDDYELILVNDGSPDNSLDIAVQYTRDDKHLVVVDLSRNFGHYKAMMTGLEKAKGDLVFLIDSDLEEEPEWLLLFYEQMIKDDSEVVFGVQKRRKGGVFERISGHWFYLLFNKMSGLSIPENMVTARLMTSDYVDALVLHEEREIFIAGLWQITGFTQKPYLITKHSSSDSTYTFRRKLSILVNSITSFSNAPLVGIFYLGILISFLSCFYITYLVFHWFFIEESLSGWTSVMASIWLLGGMIIAGIGVVGIYISKIFSETKQRPYTIVKKIHKNSKDELN